MSRCGSKIAQYFDERYWILGGRKAVRALTSKCIKCGRFSEKGVVAAPVALPNDRIRDASVFEVVGVDYAGPFILKGGKKSWIILYTCAI